MAQTARTAPFRMPKRYRNDGAVAWSLDALQAEYLIRLRRKLDDGRYRLEEIGSCLCGAREHVRVAEKDRFGLPVGVVMCTACGLLRTSPRLATECIPAFYEEDYHGLHFGRSTHDPEFSLYRKGQGHRIYSYVSDLLPESDLVVAEIGSGSGTVLREFAEEASRSGRSVNLYGAEYSSSYVEAGRSLGTDIRSGGIEALEDIPPPDLVILSHVLEHFTDVPLEMEKLRTLVQPTTVIYVEVPGVFSLHTPSVYGFDLLRYLTIAHVHHFTLETLVSTLARFGFRLERGDETVRGVFKLDPTAASPSTNVAEQTAAYLTWLERSWQMKVRRRALPIRNKARALARSGVRRVAGERGLSFIRRVRGRQ